MKTSTLIWLIPLALPLAALHADAPENPSRKVAGTLQTDDPFVGNAMCLRCHADVQTALVELPHGAGRTPEIADKGCQSCHGPGRAHVQNPALVERQPSVERMNLDERNQLCADCHSELAPFSRTHTSETISCSSCHVLHVRDASLGVLAWQGNCLSCHRGQSSFDELHDYDMSNMESGKVSCQSCHQGAHGK